MRKIQIYELYRVKWELLNYREILFMNIPIANYNCTNE